MLESFMKKVRLDTCLSFFSMFKVSNFIFMYRLFLLLRIHALWSILYLAFDILFSSFTFHPHTQTWSSKSFLHDILVTGSKLKCITLQNVYLSYHISENPISWMQCIITCEIPIKYLKFEKRRCFLWITDYNSQK